MNIIEVRFEHAGNGFYPVFKPSTSIAELKAWAIDMGFNFSSARVWKDWRESSPCYPQQVVLNGLLNYPGTTTLADVCQICKDYLSEFGSFL